MRPNAILLVSLLLVAAVAVAEEEEIDAPAPVRLDAEKLAGLGLDEFIYLLSGKLVLTDAKGEVTQYVAGESLVVPKGYLGIWEMQGDFRELVVIEKKAYVRSEESE